MFLFKVLTLSLVVIQLGFSLPGRDGPCILQLKETISVEALQKYPISKLNIENKDFHSALEITQGTFEKGSAKLTREEIVALHIKVQAEATRIMKMPEISAQDAVLLLSENLEVKNFVHEKLGSNTERARHQLSRTLLFYSRYIQSVSGG